MREQGIATKTINSPWPRDPFVYWKQKLFTFKDFPEAGQQGNFIFGDDYCIASDNAFAEGDFYDCGLCDDCFNDDRADKKFLSQFLEAPIYQIKTPKIDRFTLTSEHIDLYALSLPETRKLIVENKLYKAAKRTFNEIARKHLNELIPFD